ncbi:hypothetical protein TNCV_21601 [Trichonephila clavipes]|nr:hypothetical protein TNCV_21601 [Trichonephila clavipes]
MIKSPIPGKPNSNADCWTVGPGDSKCLIATPSLHVPTTNQVVPSPPRTATPSGTINNYDMGWRLALRAICPATDNDSFAGRKKGNIRSAF